MAADCWTKKSNWMDKMSCNARSWKKPQTDWRADLHLPANVARLLRVATCLQPTHALRVHTLAGCQHRLPCCSSPSLSLDTLLRFCWTMWEAAFKGSHQQMRSPLTCSTSVIRRFECVMVDLTYNHLGLKI